MVHLKGYIKLMMPCPILHKSPTILLVGAGPTSSAVLQAAAAHAVTVVAADGGFQSAQSAGLDVALVVGDMDSQVGMPKSQPMAKIDDQNTTDFDKCLQTCDADLFVGVGFLGGRLDHQLAAFSALLKETRPVVLIDEHQLVFVVPKQFHLDLEAGVPVGFYPMLPVHVNLQGVQWPLDDTEMSPVGKIATSNKSNGEMLAVKVDGPGLLAILPIRYLGPVLAILRGRKSAMPDH